LELTVDNHFVEQTTQVLNLNETLFHNINQTLTEVDIVLDNTIQSLLTNILDQIINMNNNGTLLLLDNVGERTISTI